MRLLNRSQDAAELVAAKVTGRSSAKEYGTRGTACGGGSMRLFDDCIDVGWYNRASANVRVEVAIAAPARTEGDVDVDRNGVSISCRHSSRSIPVKSWRPPWVY